MLAAALPNASPNPTHRGGAAGEPEQRQSTRTEAHKEAGHTDLAGAQDLPPVASHGHLIE